MDASDLKYKYSKNAILGDNPKLRGQPDSSLLNRHEEYEILYFIKKFTDKYFNSVNRATIHKIEDLTQKYLPSNIRSHENISVWLLDNWKTHIQ